MGHSERGGGCKIGVYAMVRKSFSEKKKLGANDALLNYYQISLFLSF